MRKITLLLIFLSALSISIYSEPVNFITAEKVAYNWLEFQYFLKDIPCTITLKDFDIYQYNGYDIFYFINYYPGGWVIVSGDDSAYPVIGYSLSGAVYPDELNCNTKEFLTGHINAVLEIKEKSLPNDSTIIKWNQILDYIKPADKNPVKAVEPLLTTKWNQGWPWNSMCPEDPNGPGGHVWAGCVAVAIAQIMKYRHHPVQGTGFHSYSHPDYGILQADFGNTVYNWDEMDDIISTEATAELLFHIGVAVEMNYGPNGSGSNVHAGQKALTSYFSYHLLAHIAYREEYVKSQDTDEWILLLKDQLDNDMPIFYRGGSSSGGHAFVCDGYDENDMFHFNWGWGGSYDGYFNINNLNPGGSNYTSSQEAIINIFPWSGEDYFAGGDGSEDNPYIIEDAYQLHAVRGFMDKYFIQNSHIDLDILFFTLGGGWQPIGGFENPFTGSYDGNGYTIQNLSINRPAYPWVGLFSNMSNATIKNIHIDNADITGGLIVGGIAGYANSCTIQDSSVTGSEIKGTNAVGGLAGSANLCLINASYSTGTVSGSQNRIGGLTGTCIGGQIADSFSHSVVSGAMNAGGLTGSVNEAQIINCYSTGTVIADSNPGGLIGIQQGNPSQVINSYWDIETSGQTESAGGEGRTTDQMTYPYFLNTYIGWDFDGLWFADSLYAINSGYPFIRACLPFETELDFFTATGEGNTASISWRTNSEKNISGFNIYRIIGKKVSPFISYMPVLLNPSLISSEGGTGIPAEYTFTDYVKPNGIFFYLLESVSGYGYTEEWRCRLIWQDLSQCKGSIRCY